MTLQIEVKSLGEIADYFETLASDQITSKRWQSTVKAKTECDTKAAVWRDAASILRQCKITGDECDESN